MERQKEADEAELRRFTASLEQAQQAEDLGGSKITNISELQAPSAAARNSTRLKKMLGAVMGCGVFGGIGLAFLIDLFFDQSIKRPVDIEKKLGLPLFYTIPQTGPNRRRGLLGWGKNGKRRKAGEAAEEIAEELQNSGKLEVAAWDAHHSLHAYYSTLRDRLLTYFEVKKMTHKPKLVGLTSCSKGSGVTTLASGLAASLSQTGDGNVLLVDMNVEQGAAHPFYRGKPACGLPEVLESEKRDAALVQENLYMASANQVNAQLPRLAPKKFAELFPKLKASDYDYIIFDLPPISQTSITPRMARFMDMVLVIVESEQTNKEVVRRASSLLAESEVNMTTVLNKARSYVPKWLYQEFS